MKKRSYSSSSDNRTVKKTKVQELVQEENICNRSMYTQFQTRISSIEAFHLLSTGALIAVYSESFSHPGEIGIYTLEGYYVTSVVLPTSLDVHFYRPVGVYFSRNMMVMYNLRACITRYSDYSIRSLKIASSLLDCDKDDNIYVCDKSNRLRYRDSRIDVYSPDFEKFRTINIEASIIDAFQIQEDYMVILSVEHQTNSYRIQRYSFPNVTPLLSTKLDKGFFLSTVEFLAFDPLSNVIMSSKEMNKFAIWYLDGKMSYHETDYNPRCDGYFFVVGLAMSKNFQLIRAMHAGVIRIY